MGYTTDFTGELEFSKPLTEAQVNYVNKFSGSRRMRRNPNLLKEGTHTLVDLPLGKEGDFYVDGGQDKDDSVLDYNMSPSGQPSLYCQWNVEQDSLFWDGGEKFYCYTEWLQYLIDNFFNRWGVKLNGVIDWQGEDWDDIGKIVVENSNVSEMHGRIVYD